MKPSTGNAHAAAASPTPCHCEEVAAAGSQRRSNLPSQQVRGGDCVVPVPLRGIEGLAMTSRQKSKGPTRKPALSKMVTSPRHCERIPMRSVGMKRGNLALKQPRKAKGRLESRPFPRWSGRCDLNARPLGPEPSALPGCATPRTRRVSCTCFDPTGRQTAPAPRPANIIKDRSKNNRNSPGGLALPLSVIARRAAVGGTTWQSLLPFLHSTWWNPARNCRGARAHVHRRSRFIQRCAPTIGIVFTSYWHG